MIIEQITNVKYNGNYIGTIEIKETDNDIKIVAYTKTKIGIYTGIVFKDNGIINLPKDYNPIKIYGEILLKARHTLVSIHKGDLNI